MILHLILYFQQLRVKNIKELSQEELIEAIGKHKAAILLAGIQNI